MKMFSLFRVFPLNDCLINKSYSDNLNDVKEFQIIENLFKYYKQFLEKSCE